MSHDHPEKQRISAPDAIYRPPSPNANNVSKEVGNKFDGADDGQSIHSTHTQSTTIHSQDVEIQTDVLHRTVTPKLPTVRVPRARRRGLFARFAMVAEVTNPYDYPNNMKWFITFIVAIAGAAAPVGSAIILRKSISFSPKVSCDTG